MKLLNIAGLILGVLLFLNWMNLAHVWKVYQITGAPLLQIIDR